MHIHTDTPHRPSRRSHRTEAHPPRRKALPLCLSMALAAGAMVSPGVRAGSVVPGANAGTVSVTALTSPTGGTVVGGVGSISQSGGTTVINQLSNRLALDWQTFNVGKDATVLFKQPSFTAVALNRILDQNPSQIFGRINSNGQVFLINTHGIIFGTSAQVNVGGLVASTLDLTPSDFLANHFNLDAHGGSAGVVNHGTIAAASGGSVSLLGGSVANDGLILANYGNINLDGADRAVLDFDGNGLITVEVTGALKRRLDDRAAVSNSGTLEADGGTVVLQASAAKDLFTDAVNNSGVISAGGISTDGGTVRLVAAGGNAINSGSINVSGVHGGTAQVLSDANVGVTGSIDASGALGGGTIRVGGGWQGGEGLARANVTYLGPGALLNADATQQGNGGSVVLWGDNGNNFYGSISARGGILGGDGGRVETSSHYGLNAQGSVDASAPNGAAGNWLIDPYNVTIQTGAGTLSSPFTASADSTIKASDLDAALNGTNVTVFTGSSGTSHGDITVNAAITPSAGNNALYLEAAGGIFLNANITANTSHTLNLYLWSNYGGAAAGTTYTSNASCAGGVSCVVTVGDTSNAAISTGGGTLDIRTGTGGGALTLGTGSKTGTINTAGGALTVHTTGITEVAGSNTIVAGTATLDAGSGNITLGNANDFTGTVGLTAGNAQIEDANSLVLGNGALNGSLTATAVTAITVNGAITGVGDAAFSTAALSGTGSIAGTGAITGLGSSNFALTGAKAGTYGGVAFSGFVSADATHVSGAAGFDDTALTSEGMTFAAATHVAGSGTIANVGGSFADDTGTSSTSGIAYTGFGAVTGTGGAVTGVTGNFDLGTQVSSASGLDYSGFAVSTVAGSGSGATLVGSGQTYTLDNATADKGGNGSIAWTGFGNIQDSTGTVVFGTGGSLSGSVTAKTLDYSSYGSAVNFDLSAGTGTTTGISGSWSGVTAVTGSVQGDTLAGTGQTYTLTGANAGNNGTVSWTSFENIDDATGTIGFSAGGSLSGSVTAKTLDYSSYGSAVNFDLAAGSGATTGIGGIWSGVTSVTGSSVGDTIAGNNQTYTLTGANAGNNGTVSWTAFENIADSGTGTLKASGATFNLSGSNSGTVTTLLPGGFSGIGNLDDATGTVAFAAGGGLTGNVTAKTLDYGSYGSAVNFDLSAGSGTTTGIGGSWSGVTSVTGSGASDTVAGSNQTYTLTGANAGNNGAVSWTSFENIADSGTGTLQATGATFNLGGSNSGTVTTLLPGGFSGIGNLDDATGTVAFAAGGSLTGNVTAQALDYGSYGSAVNFDLSAGSSTTTGIGGSWSGVTSVTGSAQSDTLVGTGQTYTLTGANAGNNGTVSWTGFENIADATGTIGFSAGSSLSGNATAKALDYGNYGSAVNFDLSDGSGTTTGVGGSWSGVTSVAGSGASDTIAGSNQAYTLTGANAGNNGTVSWTAFENIADSGTGTLQAANQTWSLTGHNQGSVTDLSGTFSGIGNLTDTGSGSFRMHSGADGDISGNLDAGTGGSIDYTGYGTAVNVNLSGVGSTGVGGTVSGIASITASSNLGVSGATAGSLDITTTGAGTTTTLGTLSTGTNLTVNASGTVLQSGALTVTGSTTVNTGSNAIKLTDSGNDFQGTVNLTGGTTQITDKNALTLGTLLTGDLTATSTGTLNLGTGTVGGALLATSNNGTITEGSGGVQVTGTSNLQAGTGAITLTDGNTHFGLAVTAAGQGVSLVDSGNLTIASLSSGTNGTVNLTAGGSLTLPALGIDTGTANLTLAANGGALVMPGALSGANVTLSGRDGITLGSNLTSAGTVTLTSSNGAIGQTGGVLTAGTLTGSSAGTTTLGDANLVTTLGSFSAAGFSLTNAQALTVNGAVDGGGSTTIDSTGNLILASNVSGTTTTLNAGGTIDQTGGVVTATTLNLGSAGGASLADNNLVANLGTVTNTGSGGLSFTDASGLNLAGAIDVGSASGNDVVLTVTGNLTQSGGSAISANQLAGSSTGDTTLGGSNRLNTLGSFAAANLALTNAQALAVNGPLSVPGTLSLTTTAGGLSLATDLSAATVSLSSATTLSLANNIGATTLSLTSGGAISQSTGALTVTGTTTVNAGSSTIALAGNGNDFGGTVNLTGGATQITDQNVLTLGTLSIGGLTATSTGALNLGHGTIGGNLVATSNNGSITEGSGGVQVTGTSNLQAGTEAITLTDGNTHFGLAVTAAGQGVSLVDSGNLTIASLSSGTNGTVNLTAGGSLTLPALGIDTGTANLTLAANGGALVMPGALSGANVTLSGRDGITLGSNLTSAGTVTLTSSNGAIGQTGGVLTAGTLTGSSAGTTTLGDANLVATLGSFSAADFTLTNAQALALGSNLVIGGGTGSIALTTTSGDLAIQHDINGGTIALNSAGNLSLAGNLAGSSVDLVSGGDIAQSAGVIQTGTLTGQAGGSATLARANKIGTLGNFSASNGLGITNAQALTVGGTVNGGSSTSLTTTSGSLTTSGSIGGSSIALAGQGGLAIDGAVNAGTGDITLGSAAGAISEGSAGVLTAGSLSGTSSGSTTLGGANQVVTLGNFTTGGDFSFRDARTLTVNSPLAVHGGRGNLSLTTSGVGSDLILGTGLAGGTVTLTAGRNIATSSGITATTLTGSAGGQAQLGSGNHVGTLGDFSAGSLTFGNAGALVVGGQVSTGSGALDLSTTAGNLRLTGAVTGGAVGLASASALAIDGTVSATTLALQAAGAITQSGGAITASSLSGTSGGSTTLDGANHVGSLGSFSADGLRFTNAGALSVAGPIDGGSSTRLATTSGDLAINGQVSGTTTTLVSAGAITEGSAGRIMAGTLAGQSGGATTLGNGNSIDTLGSFSAGSLSLTNGKALNVGGPVNGGTHASLTTTAGDLAVNGQLSATAVWLQSAGAITEGSGGVITASTLSGQAAGLTTLGTQSHAIGNRIDTLGNFSSTAGFSLTNGKTLTLASVDNSAFTVDAGHAELYLGVTQGDLLEQGKTPLYDGTGTFASAGHMGSGASPIYVIGDGAQLIAHVGEAPAYFYAVDRQGNILPLTGELSFNVPTSLFFGKAQNGNGRGDAYIDPSVISANYRSFGIVPSGILLPADQQACDPQAEDCGDQ